MVGRAFTTIFLGLLLSVAAQAQLKVAVVDSGLSLTDERFKDVLCESGHWDFYHNEVPVKDELGHGTHVAGTIKKYAGNSDYCLVILSYYNAKATSKQNVTNSSRALQRAVEIGASIVNYSAGGPTFNELESLVIRDNPKVTFVVAAGNDNKNLDNKDYSYFPASYEYKNIIVVGALQSWAFTEIAKPWKLGSSNYGNKVTVWEAGENIKAELPDYQWGFKSGSSMATAIATGKLIKKRSR